MAFIFAATVGLAGADAVYRLRLAVNGYYKNLDIFEREFQVTTRTTDLPSTFRVLTYVLVFSAFLSCAGTIYAVIATATCAAP